MAKTKDDTSWDELPEVMKPEQVQKKIQISRATFFRLVQSGNLPGARKVGDSWRISRDKLRAYFEGESEEMDGVEILRTLPPEGQGPLTEEELDYLDANNYLQTEDEEDSDSEQSASDGK